VVVYIITIVKLIVNIYMYIHKNLAIQFEK